METPELEHDQLLLVLQGWCGLRGGEAVGLHEQALWRDRPQVTIDRVLVRRTQQEIDVHSNVGRHLLTKKYWQQEPPKAGMTATVPVPRPLWLRLVALAGERLREIPMQMPVGRLLLRRPMLSPGNTHSIGVLDNTSFRRDVWVPARLPERLDAIMEAWSGAFPRSWHVSAWMRPTSLTSGYGGTVHDGCA